MHYNENIKGLHYTDYRIMLQKLGEKIRSKKGKPYPLGSKK